MVTDGIARYEEGVGARRHEQNTIKMDKLTAAFNRMSGAIWAVGGVVTAVSIGFEIYRTVHGGR